MIPQLQALLDLWFSLPFDRRYQLWVALGLVMLMAMLFISYRLIRAAAGHRKFRGTWFNPDEYQKLIDGLVFDQKETNRVLDFEELLIVRKHLLGASFKPIHKGKHGGYF